MSATNLHKVFKGSKFTKIEIYQCCQVKRGSLADERGVGGACEGGR